MELAILVLILGVIIDRRLHGIAKSLRAIDEHLRELRDRERPPGG